jgi:hypothetical protein
MKESTKSTEHKLPVPSSTPTQAAEPYFKSPHTPAVKSYNEDILGIISIVCIFWFPPIGIVIGLVGVHIAKNEGHDPLLSRIGWLINTALTLIGIIALVGLVCIFAFSNSKFTLSA